MDYSVAYLVVINARLFWFYHGPTIWDRHESSTNVQCNLSQLWDTPSVQKSPLYKQIGFFSKVSIVLGGPSVFSRFRGRVTPRIYWGSLLRRPLLSSYTDPSSAPFVLLILLAIVPKRRRDAPLPRAITPLHAMDHQRLRRGWARWWIEVSGNRVWGGG